MNPDTYKYFPPIRTPFTNFGGHFFTHQHSSKCNDFEMRSIECIEAYGVHHGEKKCRDYLDDLRECVDGHKRKARLEAIEAERKKQYKEGKLTKENLYPHRSDYDGY